MDNAGVGCNIGLCCLILVVLLSLPGGLGSSGIMGLDCIVVELVFDENDEPSFVCVKGSVLEEGAICDVSSTDGFNCITVTCPRLT